MHENSYNLMKKFVEKYKVKNKKVLDVGSLDVNGTYRDLFTNYTGLDIAPGKNVDIVSKNSYEYPPKDNSFEVVISGNTIEHIEDAQKWIKEIARITSDLVCIITPWNLEVHRYPIDCWRILPDGMEFLFKLAELKTLECYIEGIDTIGIARK